MTGPQSSPIAGYAAEGVLVGRRPARAAGGRPVWAVVVLIVTALYFILPLIGTAGFALSTGKQFTLQPLLDSVVDPDFLSSLGLSVFFAIGASAVAIVIVAPTAYLVELRLPRLRPIMDFVTILPFVIPPIILTLGLGEVYGINSPVSLVGSPILLIGGYFTLTLPFAYRAIDNALRAIEVRTLSEAAESLGASPVRTFLRVIVPGISLGILSAALLSFTTVMGEFTLASLLGFATFPVFLNNIYASAPREAMSLALVSFVITWLGVIAIAMVGRRTPGAESVAAVRRA